MIWRDVIDLITVTRTENDIGDTIEEETARQVFANKKSIRQSEFYQAMQTGLQPELMFEVRTSDYQGEKKLSYNNTTYSIIRTYTKNEEITELICSGLVGDG
ncbi:SPP1 family predicted phage head-tail adaptor [Melghiribacillus thermohalophilus]|uniref:SPP1 family predicted phage head-tail adaptor n=1 Tax=Melghiribacillus thermohalophilus TaxID=1324956 RepID=A0A4R3N8W9_9BACI|nr:phage head closure protein [Melghiribacillus thermohalophilus]TCT23389.1 SPP1 family predicted phage head-tail adaptor [Melghiribacillus thermohalophilus]